VATATTLVFGLNFILAGLNGCKFPALTDHAVQQRFNRCHTVWSSQKPEFRIGDYLRVRRQNARSRPVGDATSQARRTATLLHQDFGGQTGRSPPQHLQSTKSTLCGTGKCEDRAAHILKTYPGKSRGIEAAKWCRRAAQQGLEYSVLEARGGRPVACVRSRRLVAGAYTDNATPDPCGG
jgi:hypothetical protein